MHSMLRNTCAMTMRPSRHAPAVTCTKCGGQGAADPMPVQQLAYMSDMPLLVGACSLMVTQPVLSTSS